MTTRRQATAGLGLSLLSASPALSRPRARSPRGLLYADAFRNGLEHWFVELERGGRVEARDGVLDVDVPAGATVWLRRELTAPVVIEYEARAVAAGGANDRVSDLNCFWMATDARSPTDFFTRPRSGAFADYDELRTYYVGQGGNWNSTTRFRRYIGRRDDRPIRPEDDRKGPEDLLKPNVWQTIRVAGERDGARYWRDGRLIFHYPDAEPYLRGWFGLRTTKSHIQVRNFRVWRPEAAV